MAGERPYQDGLVVVNSDGTDTGGPLQFLADALLANGVDRQAAALIISTMADTLEVERKAADMNAWRQGRATATELVRKVDQSHQLYTVRWQEAWDAHEIMQAVRWRGVAEGLQIALSILAGPEDQ
jgi:hypothetical protein